MAITTIRNRTDLHRYIFTKLGSPVLHVELTEEQINFAIDDCLLNFYRYSNGNEATFLHNFLLLFKAGQPEYCMKGLGIAGAYDVVITSYFSNLTGELFSNGNMFLNYWAQATGTQIGSNILGSSTFGAGAGSLGGALTMGEYNNAMTYIKQIEKEFSPMYTLRWSQAREVLEIVPTPKTDVVGLVSLYVKEEEQFLFDNPLFRDLVVAACGVAWGDNITKFSGAMPDGLTLNGEAILTKYTTKYDKALEKIENEGGRVYDFFIG